MYLYFIRSGRSGPIKIGVAKNVESRMDNLQTGNPIQLILIAKMKCDGKAHAYNLEAYLHKIYRNRKIRGEWFSGEINLSHADRVISRCDIASESKQSDIEQELDIKSIISSPL